MLKSLILPGIFANCQWWRDPLYLPDKDEVPGSSPGGPTNLSGPWASAEPGAPSSDLANRERPGVQFGTTACHPLRDLPDERSIPRLSRVRNQSWASTRIEPPVITYVFVRTSAWRTVRAAFFMLNPAQQRASISLRAGHAASFRSQQRSPKEIDVQGLRSRHETITTGGLRYQQVLLQPGPWPKPNHMT